MEWIIEDKKGVIKDSQEPMGQEVIEKLSQYPLNESLSTLLALRILPKKEEFQKLALYSVGRKDLADYLEKTGQVFDINLDTQPEEVTNIGPDFAKEKIAMEIKEEIPNFSLTKPFIINRIIKQASLNDIPEKVSSDRERSFLKRMLFDEPSVRPEDSGVKNPLVPMTTLGTLYMGYARLFGKSANVNHFTKFVGKHPWVAPLIGAGVATGLTQMQKEILKDVNEMPKMAAVGPYTGSFLVGTPLSYYFSAQAERKARMGRPLDNIEETVRKHPLPTAIAAGLSGGALLKSMGKSLGKLGLRGNTAKNVGSKKGFFSKRADYINDMNSETINLIFKELTS